MKRHQAKPISNKRLARIQHSSEIKVQLGSLEASLASSVVMDLMVDVAIAVGVVLAVHSLDSAHSEAKAREQQVAREVEMLGDSKEQRLFLFLVKSWLELLGRPSLPRLSSLTTRNSHTSQDAPSEAYSLAKQQKHSKKWPYQSISMSLHSKSSASQSH